MPTRDQVLQALSIERDYQDSCKGTIQETQHTVGDWCRILRFYVQEAEQSNHRSAHLSTIKDQAEALSEALRAITKLAAVSVACLEQYGYVVKPVELSVAGIIEEDHF